MAAGIGLGISMGWTYAKKGFSAVIEGLFAVLAARSTYFENANNSKLSVQELETAGVLDKASIVLTPTGYSEDVIHNVKPNSGDMTHILASNAATRINKDGLVATVLDRDIPRIDYSKGEGAILAETQAVNRMIYSEKFDETGTWAPQSNSNISTTTTDDPEGNTTTVFTFEETGPGQYNLGFPGNISHSGGRGLGVSIWVKKVSGIGDTGVFKIGKLYNMTEDLETYTVGSEWQRVTWESTGGTSASHMVLRGGVGQVFAIWGAQAESSGGYGQKGTVTSYIRTLGNAITRPRDNYLNGGSASLIGAQEGVLYMESAALSDTGSRAIALSAANSAANRVVIFYSSASNTIQGRVQASTTTTIPINGTVSDATDFNKIAFKYKSGDLALWINGSEVATSTASFTFNAALSELAFDQGNGTLQMNGLVKQLAVFDEVLSDSELAALTS